MKTGSTDNNTAASSAPASSAPASSAAASAPASTGTNNAAPASSPSSSTPIESAVASLEKVAAGLDATGPASSSGQPAAAGADGPKPPASPTPPATSAAATPAGTEAPDARITNAVRNARAKIYQDLGLPADATPEHFADVKRILGINTRMEQDPAKFVRDLIAEAGLEVEDLTPSTNNGQAPPASLPALVDPKPSLRSEDGKAAYAADEAAQLATNAAERAVRKLREELGPTIQFAKDGQTAAEQASMQTSARDFSSRLMKGARELPHFKDYEKDITSVYFSNPQLRAEVGPAAALYMAYTKVLHETILPKLASQSNTTVIADLQRSANAGASTVAPQQSAPTKPILRDGNVDDLEKHMASKYQEMQRATA